MNLKRFFRFGGGLRSDAAFSNPTAIKTSASAGAFVCSGRRRGVGGVSVCAVAGLLWACAATAGPTVSLQLSDAVRSAGQSPQSGQLSAVTTVDSVLQTTVVPVIQPPVHITEHTTVYEQSTAGMDRAERRAYRAKVYAAKIDSLVQSRDYMFFPNSMQEIPGGLIRSIYADYFYFGMFIDHVEVHLPTERGISQYVEILNFDSMSIKNYQAAQVQWGWNITFNILDGDDTYHADLAVSTATGETILTLITPRLTMRYVGWLWDKKIRDPKFHNMSW